MLFQKYVFGSERMKGQLYTLESAIAILMILVILIFLFKAPRPLPEFKTINYKLKAYNSLEFLERNGNLRRDATDANATAIEEKLSPYIPDFINYTVVIFNQSTNLTLKPSFLDKKDVISVSYFLAGDIDEYSPRDVRVYLWGFP